MELRNKQSLSLRDKKIIVTGGAGFLGKHVVTRLKQRGAKNIFVPLHKHLDLTNWEDCRKVVKGADVVIHLAALIGGIGFINKRQGEVFYQNLIMGAQLMEAARLARVKKYVAIGTVCEYPERTPRPFKEKDLWDGYPEETTGAYGMAKKMAIVQSKAYRKQYSFNAVNLLPVNLYGPGDNFDRISAHVIPALIKKVIAARDSREAEVEVWGSGRATREFLYVEDAAEAIVLAVEKYESSEPVNLGTGIETSIKEVVKLIMEISGFKGRIVWDNRKPDGQPRRQLDVSKAKKLFGFRAKTKLRDGLKNTIHWYEENRLKLQ